MRITVTKKSRFRPLAQAVIVALLVPTLASASFADKVRVYVSNEGGDTIQVIDPVTNKVVQTIEGVESGQGMGFSPDKKLLYATSYAEANLLVIDRVSGKIIKRVPISGFPDTLAVAADGRVFVGIHDGAAVVDVIDGKTLEKVKSIPSPPGESQSRDHRRWKVPDRWLAEGPHVYRH